MRTAHKSLACLLLLTAGWRYAAAQSADSQNAAPAQSSGQATPSPAQNNTSRPQVKGTIKKKSVDARPGFLQQPNNTQNNGQNNSQGQPPSQTPPPATVAPTTQTPTDAAEPRPKTMPPAVVYPPLEKQPKAPPTLAPPTVVTHVPPPPPPPIFTARPGFVYVPVADVKVVDAQGSPYIPMDSWVYPAALRLYSMGYLDTAFLGIRPWTRRSLMHMLLQSSTKILESNDDEAIDIFEALHEELSDEGFASFQRRGLVYGVQTVYSRVMGIAGSPLDNSYHLGNTIVNDYGRPYAEGLNNSTGFSTLAEEGRFSLYVRAEYQHAPGWTAYNLSQAQTLAAEDEITVAPPWPYAVSTIPLGVQAAQNPMRVMEASISGHIAGHEISFGKNDAWLGPAMGGSWAWSNNAENIYGFRIDRVEPMHIPYLSTIFGPFRYEFFISSLKGHNFPNSPYTHMEKFSFRPYHDLEFGIERTVIWGGEGHEPVTIHTFLKSFFSFSGTDQTQKYSTSDPGARFSAFDASWRLPFLQKWLTLYVDSGAHDDVNPISAPRRADFRTGLYLSHFPNIPKLDLRAEAADSDQATSISNEGRATYWEVVQQQGYTNKGQIMGDWIGREGKGGQAWLTYHLSGSQQLQLQWKHAKDAKDFFPGGTTQNQIGLNATLRIRKQLEVNGYVQYEEWKAPFWQAGRHSDTTSAVQITWYPKLHSDVDQPPLQ